MGYTNREARNAADRERRAQSASNASLIAERDALRAERDALRAQLGEQRVSEPVEADTPADVDEYDGTRTLDSDGKLIHDVRRPAPVEQRPSGPISHYSEIQRARQLPDHVEVETTEPEAVAEPVVELTAEQQEAVRRQSVITAAVLLHLRGAEERDAFDPRTAAWQAKAARSAHGGARA